jgi:hypothetical protein
MGGFAGSHHNTVARLEERGIVRLVCTCDPPGPSRRSSRPGARRARRAVFDDYRAMLDACHGDLDYVVIADPDPPARRDARGDHAFGLPAYVEKPPTLDYAELERMIAADRRARKSSLVGFNFIVEKSRLALKERLLSGEFGAIRGGTLSALWPRPASYFTRNGWAGRLIIGRPGRPRLLLRQRDGALRPQHALLDRRRPASTAGPRSPRCGPSSTARTRSRAPTPSSSRRTWPRAARCGSRSPTPAPARARARRP